MTIFYRKRTKINALHHEEHEDNEEKLFWGLHWNLWVKTNIQYPTRNIQLNEGKAKDKQKRARAMGMFQKVVDTFMP